MLVLIDTNVLLRIADSAHPLHPAATQAMDENVAAIQASLNDMLAGETGRDASDVMQGLRERLNLSAHS